VVLKEDLCRLTVSQNRLKDKLQSKDDMLTVRAHLLSYKRIKVEKMEKNRAENVATRVAYAHGHLFEGQGQENEDADSLRVEELTELNRELPVKS
jgi:hypothetical protein